MQLTKISTSRISEKGPPFAVSAISHLTISSLRSVINHKASRIPTRHTHSSRPIFLKRSTAPRPQRPRAPMTRALTPFPLPPRAFLTSSTMAVSFA